MNDITYLTQEGYDKLVAEIDELKSTGRAEAAAAIAEAREKGDLSENAEYDAAKDAQGMLEMKINELEKTLAIARIIDSSQLDSSRVTILSKVTIENTKTKKEITYQIVAETEADIKAKKLSVKSPIGDGLLGKEEGDTVVITTPRGDMEFIVKKITL